MDVYRYMCTHTRTRSSWIFICVFLVPATLKHLEIQYQQIWILDEYLGLFSMRICVAFRQLEGSLFDAHVGLFSMIMHHGTPKTCRIRQYGVATISRLLKITGLVCERALLKRQYSAKETYNFEEPTDRSHPIPPECLSNTGLWQI